MLNELLLYFYLVIQEFVFYGTGVNVMAGIGLLSTSFTVREAGWASLAVLVLFAVVCCYTATLMRRCFETKYGIWTFADMGEAAFGKFGRILVSVSRLNFYCDEAYKKVFAFITIVHHLAHFCFYWIIYLFLIQHNLPIFVSYYCNSNLQFKSLNNVICIYSAPLLYLFNFV